MFRGSNQDFVYVHLNLSLGRTETLRVSLRVTPCIVFIYNTPGFPYSTFSKLTSSTVDSVRNFLLTQTNDQRIISTNKDGGLSRRILEDRPGVSKTVDFPF